MNGAHDLGGMHGFGPVEPEANEPVFHADWERRAFALITTRPKRWTSAEDRYACENQAPADYLTQSYYENWLTALEKMLVKCVLITADELRAGEVNTPADSSVVPLRQQEVEAFVFGPGTTETSDASLAKFSPGDTVRARNLNPQGHTRMPRFVRGRRGIIANRWGCQAFPESSAHGTVEHLQWVYGVEFAAPELWGPDGNAGDSVCVDMWESYLEADV
jgi:nitrile hydratase